VFIYHSRFWTWRTFGPSFDQVYLMNCWTLLLSWSSITCTNADLVHLLAWSYELLQHADASKVGYERWNSTKLKWIQLMVDLAWHCRCHAWSHVRWSLHLMNHFFRLFFTLYASLGLNIDADNLWYILALTLTLRESLFIVYIAHRCLLMFAARIFGNSKNRAIHQIG